MITAHRPRGTDREASPIKEPSAGQANRPVPNKKLDRLLDEALEGTFPASDPVAWYLGKD